MARPKRELREGRTRKVSEKPAKDEATDYTLRESGLYVPQTVPDGGRRPPVGFSRALHEPTGES